MIENSKAQNDPAKPGRGRPQKNEPGMVRVNVQVPVDGLDILPLQIA